MPRRFAIRLFALAVLSSCTGSSITTPPGGDAGLAVFNALADGESTVLTLDGRSLALPISGGKSSSTITAGSHRIEAKETTGVLLAAEDFSIAEGESRSLMVVRSGATTLRLLMFRDTAAVPAPSQIKIRVIHAADEVEPMAAWLRIQGTVRDGSTLLATSFTQGFGTDARFDGYAIRAPGFYLVTGTSPTSGTVLVENGKHLAGGHIWNAVLVRLPDGGLTFHLFRDK